MNDKPTGEQQAGTTGPTQVTVSHRPRQGRTRFRRGLWLTSGAAAILILIVAAVWFAPRGTAKPRYITAEVTRGAVTRTVTATGTVNPILTVIVGSAISGIIQDITCDYNTLVKVGQVCARIDPRPYQAAVDQAKAAVDVDRAQLTKDDANRAYARANYQRLSSLVPKQYASKNAVDSAKAALQQAEAQIAVDKAVIEQDQAKLSAAEANLGYTSIASPVSGVVVSRNVTIGQTVAASFQTPTLFLIATDLTRMQVDTNVSEGDIGNMKKGEKASFTVLAFPGLPFHGMVTQVRQSPQTVQNVVTYDVVVAVDNRDLKLKPGMTSSVQIVTAQRLNVIRVPDQALRYVPSPQARAPKEKTSHVWVLRQGKPVAVLVVTGLDDDTNTEIIKGGLRPGEAVITGEQRTKSSPALLPRF